MKVCDDHWGRLNQAIDARGLGALRAENGEEVSARLMDQLQSGVTVDNFEPLLIASHALIGNLFNLLVPEAVRYVLAEPICPLCQVNEWARDLIDEDGRCKHCGEPSPHVGNYDGWIDRAADDAVEIWQSFKL